MAIRFAVYTAALYAGLAHNAFCAQEHVLTCNGEFRAGHLTGDCAFVVNRLRLPDAGAWDSMAGWDRGTGFTPYRSQFGLQAVALAAVGRATGASPEQMIAFGNVLFGLAAAALLAAFFASVAGRVGPLAGHAGVLLTACSPPLLALAPAVYWALPATLAPFVFAWLTYPWAARSRWNSAAFLGGLVALVCVKGLCGYEYITTVIVSPVAAVVYHRAAAGDGLRRWLRPAVAVGVAGLVGFAAAVGLHAAQVSALTGGSGLAVIRERAASRTAVPNGDGVERIAYPVFAPELPSLPERVAVPVRCFVNYFYQPAASSPQTWGRGRFAASLGWVLAAAGLGLVLLWRVRARYPAAAALAPATAVGLLGAVSWQALAVNHMVFHGHLNLIVFCVPCLPLAFAGIGAAVGVAAGRHEKRVARCLAAAAVIVVGVNAAVMAKRASDRAALDATAAERVRAVLRGDEAAGPPETGRATDPLVGPLPADPAYLPNSLVFAKGYSPAVADADAPLGVYGWLMLSRESSGRLPLAVVAVRGSQVVPVRVGYYRLAAVEKMLGREIACVAYQAVIPAGTFAPGERPRLFAVSPLPGRPVIELTAKP